MYFLWQLRANLKWNCNYSPLSKSHRGALIFTHLTMKKMGFFNRSVFPFFKNPIILLAFLALAGYLST